MIKLCFDVIIRKFNIRVSTGVVFPVRIVDFTLNDLCHVFNPFRGAEVRQRLPVIRERVKAAVSVFMNDFERLSYLLCRCLMVDDVVFFSDPLNKATDLFHSEVKGKSRQVGCSK